MSGTHFTEKQCRAALERAFKETAPVGHRLTIGYWMEAYTPAHGYSIEVAPFVRGLKEIPKADYPIRLLGVQACKADGYFGDKNRVQARAMQILLSLG